MKPFETRAAASEPDEVAKPAARSLRCPRCGQRFDSMRRWQLACPQCGHTWEEQSRRGVVDALLDYREHAVFGLFCAAGLAFLGSFFYVLGIILWPLLAHGAIVMLALIAGLVLALFLAARIRPFTRGEDELRTLQRRERDAADNRPRRRLR